MNTFMACEDASSSVLVVKATSGSLDITMKGCMAWATDAETGSCDNVIGTMTLDDSTPWVTFTPSAEQVSVTSVEALSSEVSGIFMFYVFAIVSVSTLSLA